MNRKQHRAEARQRARTLRLGATPTQQIFAAALRHHQAGRLNEAERLCRQVLALESGHADSMFLLGVMAGQLGRHDQAIDMIGKAIALDASVAAFHYNLATALQQQGRLAEAIACHRKAIELQPDFPEAHSNLGVALMEQGRLDEAVACQRAATELRPDFPEAHNNLGAALQKLGRLGEAAACFRRAVALRADFAEAHNNLGSVLEVLRGPDQAVDCYCRAIELRPDYAEAHINLGGALGKAGRLGEAAVCYRRAVELRGDDAQAHGKLATALADLGRLDEALASYDKAIALKADLALVHGQRLHTKMSMCEWQDVDDDINDMTLRIARGENAAPPFSVVTFTDCPELHRGSAEIYVKAACRAVDVLPAIARHPPHEKIRLGYFSADFREHAMSYQMAGLFEQHDRTRFDVFGFSLGPETNGPMYERLAAAFDKFIDVRHRPDRDIALLTRQLEIDIAVDLNGFTRNERINVFSHRAAPLQVNYLGYPGTSGAGFMDYVIADSTLIPEAEQRFYSEKIIYLPHSYQVNDSKRPIADRVFTREELQLPEAGFVYCCFNNNHKIMPAVFDIWMRILRRVEGSVLWLLADNPWAERNLGRAAAARGVAAGRLVFAQRLPLAEHLARQRAADLFIDTLPYNGHGTASGALWAGLPVLTRCGKSFPGRVAASLLKAIDLPELITTTAEEYERRAIELALNPGELTQIRVRLARNRLSTPLFDTELFARHIERGFSRIYQRYHAGLAPDHLHVPAE
jgi:predicted O-linked N-acetylglucosamine transferase (SPINDLY family)